MKLGSGRRRRIVGVVALIILAVAIYVAVTRGAFDAALLAIAAYGLLLGLVQALPQRPKLDVSFAVDGEPVEVCEVARDARVQPIDVRAIVASAMAAANDTAPERPRPARTFQEMGLVAAARILQPTDEHYAKFERIVEAYGAELDQWLRTADNHRRTALHELRAHIRLDNTGQGQAVNTRVRLFFPAGWRELDEEAAELDDPPEQPTWDDEMGLFPSSPRVPRLNLPFMRTQEPPRGDLSGPTYSRQGARLVVTYNSRHLSAGLGEHSAYPIELQAPGVGEYDIEYEVFSDGLAKPQRGSLPVVVHPVQDVGEPICHLHELAPEDDDE